MAGFLSRFLRRPEPVETRDAFGGMPGFPGAWGIGEDLSGRPVSPVTAENLAAVSAAVGAISSAVASLAPLAFYREGGGRTELPPGHWLARLMRSPSPRFTYPEWCESLVADCLLRGNALCEIVSDAGGRVVALEPIGWRYVSVVILPSGRIAYDVAPPATYRGEPARTRRLLDDEVLHLRDRLDAGEVIARSRLARAAGAVQNIASLQDMSEAVWRNAMRIGGILTTPNYLTKDARTEADALLEKFRGAQRAGKVSLLEGGWKWESLSIDAETAQTLESRKFSVIEIARIYNIVPQMLQDHSHSTFTNSEQASRWFGQFTIAPWARKLEAALQRCVIGAGSDLTVELDLSTLLRGSDLERWQTHKIAAEIGAVDPAEIRQAEGWGPRIAPAAPPPPSNQQPEPVA